MRRILLALLMLSGMAHAATITVNPSQSQATIQSISNSAVPGADTILFSAGTYNFSSGFTGKCGITYTGPVATPATAIINSTFSQGGSIFNFSSGSGFANPCTQATTVQYFHFQNSGGVYIQTSFTNITVVHNQFTNLPCCAGGPSNIGLYVDGAQSTSNTAQSLTNAVFSFNSFGDSASCTSPTNGMTDTVSPETGNAGACGGMSINTTLNGLVINNNNFFHLGEAIHVNCPGGGHPGGGHPPPGTPSEPCEPTQNGVTTTNLSVQFNDFNQIHRIPWEEQPQTTSGVVFQNNVMHDWFDPTYFSFGVSFACCLSGGSSPFLNASNNVVIFNTAPAGRYGYGSEDWGRTPSYNNWLIQSAPGNSTSIGMAWTVGSGGTFNNNTVCGSGFAAVGYITTEGEAFSTSPSSVAGNSTFSPCTGALTSTLPTISPPAGAASFPLTVTLHDTGYTSGPQPLGNTGIWYTTDGSTPVPGAACTAPCGYLADGGTFSLAAAGTVRAVGMWGAANQPASYATGYGFKASAAVSATYTGGGPPTAATPVFAPTSQTFTGSLSVGISDSTTGSSIYYTTDGATPVAGPGGAIIGTQYYVSPTGSDSNNGTSVSTPWLSPNHAVNCGDVLNAAAGTYSTINFTAGKWGTVTCTSGNNVAWLKCTTFDACKISSTTADAMWVDKSFWGVQGWEASTNGSSNNEAACFRMTPSGAYILHHVVFANDIANGCQGGGYGAYNTSTTAGEDYLNVIGSIAYNAAQGAGQCFSGISMYQPINSDTVAGTHIFIGGNFSYGNVDPATCAGGPSTDGEAVIIDTPDGSQGHLPNPYTGQVAVENNIGFFNGGRGFEVYNNQTGSSHAPIYFEHNTSFGNSTDLNQTNGCDDRGELYQQNSDNVTWVGNLAQTRNGTSCSAAPLYGFIALGASTGSIINASWWSGIGGHNTDPNTPSAVLGTGNTIGTNPAFTNPVNPSAPSCSGTASVPACMATVIANYTPTTSGSTTLGYQTPSPDAVSDPLFPQWLCNVNLPAGLISSACSPIYTGPLTLSTTTTVQAIAAAPSFVNSSVASGTYTVSTPILTGGIQGNTPNVNSLTVGAPAVQQLAIGTYSDGVTRNLPDSFGNTPVWTSSAPTILQVTSTGLVSCLAPGNANSLVKSAPGGIIFNVWGWTCNSATSTVATPVLTPATENFSGTLSVSISTATAGATIHYTTDGSTPTATSPTYTGPLSIVATTVVKALGVLAGDNPSAVATATYTQVAATISQITLSIVGSTFVNYVLVGGTAHFQANIQYSDGVILPSTTVGVNNARGDSISSWTTSSSMVGTISTGGVFTGVALGSATIQAVINGTLNSSNWVEYVSKSITTNVAGATMRGVTIQ